MSTNVNPEDRRDAVTIDHSPTRLSAVMAVAAAVIAALTSAPFAILAMPLGFGGLVLIAGGLFVNGSRSWLSLGVGGLFAGVLVSGAYGLDVELVLVSATAAIVAWDVGQNAIGMGEQLGSQAPTRRAEIVHASVSTLVGALVAAFSYGIYQIAAGGQPAAALVLLLAGAVMLIWAIRS